MRPFNSEDYLDVLKESEEEYRQIRELQMRGDHLILGGNREIVRVIREYLEGNQVELDPDAKKILEDNKWDLYE